MMGLIGRHRRFLVGILLGGLTAGLPAAPAMAGSVVGLPAIKDNTLYQDLQGGFSNGAGQHLFAGTIALGGDIRRGLLAFDIADQIPAGSTINSVTLRLNMSRTIVGDQRVSLYRMLSDWGEGASDAPAQEGTGDDPSPGDATWLHNFYDSSFWSTPGGDFSADPRASVLVGGSGLYTWGSTPDMVTDVQAWLDNPASSFGWMVRGNEVAFPTAKRFDSREHPLENNRPLLTVDYTPVPEPGTAGLMILAGLVICRRPPRHRRRGGYDGVAA